MIVEGEKLNEKLKGRRGKEKVELKGRNEGNG